ncbi:maturase [Dictyobacter vulcani]|uniref:Maturase n=1 Tax=Dictyobacter vulcani TaxID=2607529 RepID=A0A5J4KNM1_9CHLR|nr:group II intron reverse transcriptase/maturase [Dictyobacter vulcani]GER87699.1 maturase [Dictyobacter vulcani]
MSHETLERLETLQKLNSNKQWTNKDLYRLMYKEDLYIVAYERIKSKPGNMSPGIDAETLDGYSINVIQKIIQDMRTEQFQFKPVRIQYIPKSNGKMRKLGIPSARDKVVQEVMYIILSAIYDSPLGSFFSDASHGFRIDHSCHTALREIRSKWSAVNWYIEGDIQACFDEIDHNVLLAILQKKIKDERFLNLIRKLLHAGYMDLKGNRKDSLVGTPQGGILSPILANIYLHELDEFIDQLKMKLEKGNKKRSNPVYHRLANRKSLLVARGETKTAEFQQIIKHMRLLPSTMVNDPDFIRIKYLRYADDWIIGLCGNRQLAEEIKSQVAQFLQARLKLTLQKEKTSITNARTETGFFLGTQLQVGRDGEPKVTPSVNKWGKQFKRRSTGWETYMAAPLSRLIQRLSAKGFCTTDGKPIAKTSWIYLDMDQIVNLYSSTNRGIQNYYRFVDNWTQLIMVQHILEISLARTLARKYQISVNQVFKRFGKGFTTIIKDKDGKVTHKVTFYLNQDWTKKRDAFHQGKHTEVDLIRSAIRQRTRSKLGMPCCICGKTAIDEQIEMHHIRHIRKLSEKRIATGFNQILRKLNRKQIPVCRTCHSKIHGGSYDSLRLSQLAYVPR